LATTDPKETARGQNETNETVTKAIGILHLYIDTK